MVWLFLSVLLVVVVYLAIQFPAFRKALRVGLALLFIVIVAGAGWLYYTKLEDDKRTELSRHLIRPDEIVFTDAVLGQTYGSWQVKGNVTNRSAYELEGFAKDQGARLSCIWRALYDGRRERGLNVLICPTKPNASL